MTRHLPTLVECEPYNAKLTKAACVKRWRTMQETVDHPPAGNVAVKNAARKNALILCADCKVGAKRSRENR